MAHDIAVSHQPDLLHHVNQAASWLTASDSGDKTAALSYAAFELRYAVERLAVHYWSELLGRQFEERELRDIGSFKTVEHRIYELGGHQSEINGHFEFMRVMLVHLQIADVIATPNIGALSRYWHRCSEICHIAWVLGSGAPELRTEAFRFLSDVLGSLREQLQGACGWPSIREPALLELRNRFVAGDATAADIRAHLAQTGVWARVEHHDGRMEFTGEAIPPARPQGEA